MWQRYLTTFYSKLKFGQISPKTRISFDVLENLCKSKFEGNKKKYESNILRYYISNIKLGKLAPKWKSRLHENSHNS